MVTSTLLCNSTSLSMWQAWHLGLLEVISALGTQENKNKKLLRRIKNHHPKGVEQMLKAKADPNCADEHNVPALATGRDREKKYTCCLSSESVLLLLDHGALVTCSGNEINPWQDAVHQAHVAKHVYYLQALARRKTIGGINKKGRDGITPLHNALILYAESGHDALHASVVRLLVTNGARVLPMGGEEKSSLCATWVLEQKTAHCVKILFLALPEEQKIELSNHLLQCCPVSYDVYHYLHAEQRKEMPRMPAIRACNLDNDEGLVHKRTLSMRNCVE